MIPHPNPVPVVIPARCRKAIDQLVLGVVYYVTLGKQPDADAGEPGEFEVRLQGQTRTYSRGFFEAVKPAHEQHFPRIKRVISYANDNTGQDAA